MEALVGEIREARRALGLSLAAVAAEVGISAATLSRIERRLVPDVSFVLLVQLCEVVGLEASTRAYPGGRPLRDDRHAALLDRFREKLHSTLRWRTEVPMPRIGDKRAWDGTVTGADWYVGVEAELNPIDGQALLRRLQLKKRDGEADGVILLLPDTRQTRQFRREYADLLAGDFAVSGPRALELLAAGVQPPGGAVVVLSARPRKADHAA